MLRNTYYSSLILSLTLSYIAVYAKHYGNVSSSQYGLLNMILPFVTIITKLFFCSLADRHQAHRSFFISFLLVALLGYGSFAVLPFFIAPKPESAGLNVGIWTLICIMTSVATMAMSVISCLSDAFAVNSAAKRKTSYGLIRLWGTLGWGLSALLIAFINQFDKLPFLVPGLVLLITLIGSDLIIMSSWSNKEDFILNKSAADIDCDHMSMSSGSDTENCLDGPVVKENTNTTYGSTTQADTNGTSSSQLPVANPHDISDLGLQWILFKEVASRRKSIFRYMTLFIISGSLISLQWSYFFLFLEQIYNADFAFISGLSMVGQSMLGELPFFMISKFVIQSIGRSHTLSLSIMSIGLRFLLYRYLLPNASMYFVLLTETFQGPNFGLFYVVMTEVGLDYSECEQAVKSVVDRGMIENDPQKIQKLRQALRATMQSLMSACYEGLGVGIGSIIGGLMIEYVGFNALWYWAAIVAILLGAFNMAIDLICLPILTTQA